MALEHLTFPGPDNLSMTHISENPLEQTLVPQKNVISPKVSIISPKVNVKYFRGIWKNSKFLRNFLLGGHGHRGFKNM